MESTPRNLLWIGAAALALALAGCRAAAPAATVKWTDTLTPTPSNSPTATDTPTGTFTPTETPTDTPTFTPTLPYNAPGQYMVYLCTFIAPSGSMQEASEIKFCITTVNVLEDRTMRFNVNWTFIITPRSEWDWHPRWLSKLSDKNNTNISLEDDLQNHYSPIDVTGCIAEGYILRNWTGDCGGSFFFYPAKAGATSFTYYDAGYGIAIGPIVLLNVPPTPTATRTGTQKTPTPTKTPTFTRTQTPTPTVDPNAVYNAPGTYWIYKCIPYPAGGDLARAKSVMLCLNTVVVNDDRTMKFNFTWKVETDYDLIKEPDANKDFIYLEDDLANVYRFIGTGGCAAERTEMQDPGDDCNGWFLFPAADPEAKSFRFVDSNVKVSFDNIVLALL